MADAPNPIPVASTATAALEAAWAAIRVHHPEVPLVYIAVASGKEGSRVQKWGHWAASRWATRGDGEGDALGEVMLAGERMEQGGAAVMGTLLHEAAHALASVREIRDTSGAGSAYHNGKYKKLAAEVLLTVEKGKKGWSTTALNVGSETRYSSAIAMLDEALQHFRVAPGQDGEDKKKPRVSRVPLTCKCAPKPRKLLITPTDAIMGAIPCPLCKGVFWDEAGKLGDWFLEQQESGAGLELGPGVGEDVMDAAGGGGQVAADGA